MKIIASSNLTVSKKDRSGKFGPYQVYSVEGPTFPIKDRLKSMGFSWNNLAKAWDISAQKMTGEIMSKLKSLGVSSLKSSTQETSPSELVGKAPQQGKEASSIPLDTENEERTRWYKFPIKDNIYQKTITIKQDGKDVPLEIRVHRTFQPGKDTYAVKNSREFIGFPKYYFEVGNISMPRGYGDDKVNFSENPVEAKKKHDGIFLIAFMSKEKWGTYDEENKINEYICKIKEKIQESGVGKIKQELNAREMGDDLKEFLKENNHIDIVAPITFEDSRYNGTFKFEVRFANYSEKLWISNADLMIYINHPYFKDRGEYLRTNINVSGVKTLEELKEKAYKQIVNSEHLRSELFEKLSSVPYLEEQYKQEQESTKYLLDILENPESYYYEILQELRKRNYVRVNKRSKSGDGLASDSNMKWVVDSDAIKDDFYGKRDRSSGPKVDIYTVIGYYIHRRVRGISSWSDIMLVDGISSVYSSIKKLHQTITVQEVQNAIEKIAELIIKNFFSSQRKKTTYEQWQDFESGFANSPASGPLEELYRFGKEYGVERSDLEDSPKAVFRFLSKKVHPDTSTDPKEKEEKEIKFKELINIWDKLPMDIKQSFNYGIFLIKKS